MKFLQLIFIATLVFFLISSVQSYSIDNVSPTTLSVNPLNPSEVIVITIHGHGFDVYGNDTWSIGDVECIYGFYINITQTYGSSSYICHHQQLFNYIDNGPVLIKLNSSFSGSILTYELVYFNFTCNCPSPYQCHNYVCYPPFEVTGKIGNTVNYNQINTLSFVGSNLENISYLTIGIQHFKYGNNTYIETQFFFSPHYLHLLNDETKVLALPIIFVGNNGFNFTYIYDYDVMCVNCSSGICYDLEYQGKCVTNAPIIYDYYPKSIYKGQNFNLTIYGENLSLNSPVQFQGEDCIVYDRNSTYIRCQPIYTLNNTIESDAFYGRISMGTFSQVLKFDVECLNCGVTCINGECVPPCNSICIFGSTECVNTCIGVYAIYPSYIYLNENLTMILYGKNLQDTISVTYGSRPCHISYKNETQIICDTITPSVSGYSSVEYVTVNLSWTLSQSYVVFMDVLCRDCNGTCSSGICYPIDPCNCQPYEYCFNGVCYDNSSYSSSSFSSSESSSLSSSESSGSTSSEDELIVCNYNRSNQTISITNYGTESVEIVCNGSGNVNCYNNSFKCKSFDSYSEIQCSSFNQITCFANNTITCNTLNFQCKL